MSSSQIPFSVILFSKLMGHSELSARQQQATDSKQAMIQMRGIVDTELELVEQLS